MPVSPRCAAACSGVDPAYSSGSGPCPWSTDRTCALAGLHLDRPSCYGTGNHPSEVKVPTRINDTLGNMDATAHHEGGTAGQEGLHASQGAAHGRQMQRGEAVL